MRIARYSLVALLFAACAAPLPPAGPRATGARSSASVGGAELDVRYRYEPLERRQVVLHVDLASKQGAAAVAVEVKFDGFELVAGAPRAEHRLAANANATEQVTLGAPLDATLPATASVTVITRDIERGVELTSDRLRFIILGEGVGDDDSIRECRPDDAACQ
jgi:hypothetical protein